MTHAFFACLSRLKLISRWSLMRNTQPENDAEHSLQVAMIAHAIAMAAPSIRSMCSPWRYTTTRLKS